MGNDDTFPLQAQTLKTYECIYTQTLSLDLSLTHTL